ncbi:MAG: Tn3 family transposase [Candidatus Dormibacteraeota bacterium]|nr:Tn3 family transposase [Candidatus Dormibacteraeota bacterium]
MQRHWSPDELSAQWTLTPDERTWLANKTGATRLGFAVLLKSFLLEGRFPHQRHEIPTTVVAHVAHQVGVAADLWPAYDWSGRTIKYHRAEIRDRLGFREATLADLEALSTWLTAYIIPQAVAVEPLQASAYERLRAWKVEPPTADRLERLIRSAVHTWEAQFADDLVARLGPTRLAQFEALVGEADEPSAGSGAAEAAATSGTAVPTDATGAVDWLALKADPGRLSLDTLRHEVAKLQRLRQLALPTDLFQRLSAKRLQHYRRRVVSERTREVRRHPSARRALLLAAFCWVRQRELTDGLVDLLIQLVHKLGVRAERKVERTLLEDLKRVSGKTTLLFQLAEAALAHPDGVVREVVYPVVAERTLQELVREYRASGRAYRTHVQTVMRTAYQHHYRRMVPLLLAVLEFRSNNAVHRPVLEALALLRRSANERAHYYVVEADVPLEGVVRAGWRELIVERTKDGRERVNRITYELCVLQALREKLRAKEIWVVGADRYRNPDEDLPADFAQQRAQYYAALQLPADVEAFISRLQQAMASELTTLDRGLPKNPAVRILAKGHGWIAVSPIEPQAEPANLTRLKATISQRWPMTSLLDVLKETDLRVHFTEVFRSAAVRETLERATLQRRLLLCLYGLGTNTGLKRVSAGDHGESYPDLLYVRRRFLDSERLRQAIAQVVNATFRARVAAIWGEGTTACASDSKKVGAWDQNLLTEWHIRYGGRGVMIYWHVERHAACIYSQLKTCSSSEVAAMIEGVLRHCTEMTVEKNYVDSHGQSEVAFAFCHLLGFQLLPRLKRLHAQKLYRPTAGQPDAYPRLQLVLTRPINWELIRQQYDPMVQYATALRLGTAETEALLRRFTRGPVQHPTYQALAELGKAAKTLFLCRYLHAAALRREIQEGLNVIENWNSANSFIFYGKGGELATNRLDDQELAVLALHLLQSCLVYINTLMIQQVLAEPAWTDRLTPEDLRGLTPLIYSHINPYGTFRLNMAERLALAAAEASS